MRQPLRVVLADDHDAFVEGLGMVLSAEDDLEVVAVAGDGAGALQAVLAHQPDVLVADTRIPGLEIGELVRLVGTAQPATRVLLLAEDALSAPTGQADPGPAGTTRAVSGHELAEAIRQMAAGGWVTMAPAEPAATTPTPPARPERDDSLELSLCSLSERERQVLALLGRGYANRRIAEICNLSLNTVRTHVQNVLVKLGVHSKLEAAAIAVRHGLVHG
jgi:DNA-binding NarL/FixJ family response regulator